MGNKLSYIYRNSPNIVTLMMTYNYSIIKGEMTCVISSCTNMKIDPTITYKVSVKFRIPT